MTATLASSHHMPLSCGKPAWLVVLLHAHGTHAEHILELAVEWAPHLLKAEFIALQPRFHRRASTTHSIGPSARPAVHPAWRH